MRIVGSRWFALVPLGLIVIGGTIPRVNHIGKSLWTAEAWVANSALRPSLRQMFYYDAWLQTTPPLFLLLLRETVRFAGISTYSLRAVPLTLAVLSLIVVACLARTALRPPFAVLLTLLVALSPPAVVFGKEVKQYSGDLLACALILLVLWKYHEQPRLRRYLLVLLVFTACMLLSYPAVCFLPLACWVLLIANPMSAMDRAERRTLLARLVIFITATCAIGAIEYWFLIRPNTSPLLTAYWQNGYPPFGQWRQLPKFYAENYLGMGIYYYLPMQAKDLLKASVLSGGYLFMACLALAAVGILQRIATLWKNRHYRQIFVFCLLPVCTMAGLNALRLYPVSSRRVTLFLLPCASLLVVGLLQAGFEKVGAKCSGVTKAWTAALFVAFCVVAVFVLGTHSDNWGNFWSENEDTDDAVLFLKSQVSSDDTVYIHASITEPAKLYFEILKWTPPGVRYGTTGWACCTRNFEPVLADEESKQRYVLSNFQQVMRPNLPARVWLMFTGRTGHWEDLGRDESEIITHYLQEQGCHEKARREFAYDVVMGYACDPRAPARKDSATRSETIPIP